jgi:hypothetical protein
MSPRDLLLRALFAAVVCLCLAQRASAQASAERELGVDGERPVAPIDSESASSAPQRYLGMASVGAPLRLTKNEDYGQDTLAPAFSDLLLGYVFAARSGLRHGVGVGVSFNITDDGGYAEPVYAGEQVALMPAYLLYADLGSDLFGLGHAGVPIVVTGGTTAGAELGAAVGYRLLAGAGIFAELSAVVFGGTGASLNPMVGLEAGLFLDYEVLP